MINQLAERTIARTLGIGSAFVAIIVVTGSVTDPVNVTKLFAIGGVAISAFAVVLVFGIREVWTNSRTLILVSLAMLVAGLNAIYHSDGPLVQNIYGVYGRNTGFLTYVLLLLVLVSASVLRRESSFLILIWGLFAAGLINVVYSLTVITFGDFISWSNPYGNILGTFGNPNFIGAFLGFFGASLIAFILKSGVKPYVRVMAVLVFILNLYAIIDSSAIQGRVVVAAGLCIVGFYSVRSRFKGALIQIGYVSVVATAGIFALLGALQKGPLSPYIYKTSVSLRGEYWQAGWNMGVAHPLTGVGFDTYGDWYRRSRDIQALVLPGPNTVTNAAHNVPFDVLAFGGWPLFISYLVVVLLSLIAIVKVTLRQRQYDAIFVTLTTAWAGYQLQSIISINQIGLAVWGWLFGGALIAYEVATRPAKVTEVKIDGTPIPRAGRKVGSKQSENIFSSTLIAGIGGVIGLLIACPPYSADAKWRAAITSQSVQKVEDALIPGYLNPMNSYKYASAVQLLESSKLFDLAAKYARIGVEFNPDHFDSWRMLYFITNSTSEEKSEALANMKRLDPNNPNVLG